jgi:hypothetical protein
LAVRPAYLAAIIEVFSDLPDGTRQSFQAESQ